MVHVADPILFGLMLWHCYWNFMGNIFLKVIYPWGWFECALNFNIRVSDVIYVLRFIFLVREMEEHFVLEVMLLLWFMILVKVGCSTSVCYFRFNSLPKTHILFVPKSGEQRKYLLLRNCKSWHWLLEVNQVLSRSIIVFCKCVLSKLWVLL